MAERRVITLIDDLAHDNTTVADETVSFALDGTQYEIDLTTDNARTLRARLKEFIQAARTVKAAPRRVTQPAEALTGGSATSSRHQGGVSPTEARAWAVKNGIRVPKRGRLPKDIKEAYNSHTTFGDRKPLDAILKSQKAEDSTTLANQPTKPFLDPAGMLLNIEAPTLTPQELPQPTQESAPVAHEAVSPDEAEALNHYTPLTRRNPAMADDKKWARRTGYGNSRTSKIAEWTLTERIATLSAQHHTILGQLAGILIPKNGTVSHLKTSATRLQNLEFIQYTPDSPHGWEITEFGRYAHQMYSGSE